MASVGFVNFVTQRTVPVCNGRDRRPRFSFQAYRPSISLGCSGSEDPVFGYSREDCVRFSLCRRRQVLGSRGVKARGEGSVEEEGGDEVENAFDATIEKSKKVLAMQRNLLQQNMRIQKLREEQDFNVGTTAVSVAFNISIAERRKLVSSIKSSVINPEDNEVSYKDQDSSFPNMDPTSTGDSDSDEDHNGGILSGNYVHSNADKVSAALSSVISKGLGEGKKELGKDLSLENPSLDLESPKQLQDTSPVRVWSDPLPSFLSKSVETAHPKEEKQEEFKQLSSEEANNEATVSMDDVWSDPLPSFLLKSVVAASPKEEKQEEFKKLSTEEVNNEATVSMDEDVKPPPLAGTNVMNVILVAAECAPWSKTGGLGDVAGALPKALARRGHRVMVVAPRYGNYAEAQDTGVRKRYKVDGQDMEVTYFQAYIDGVDFVFVDSPMFHHIEKNIYGGHRLDILKRMILFCKAAVEVPWHVPCGGVCYGDGNLVFIANDWHTALLPVYLKAYYRDNGLMKYTRSVLVIHNIAHQGRGPVEDFFHVDLPEHYLDLFKLHDPVGGDHFNIFAAGLKTADQVVTVSHGYAWELKTSEGGWGLHHIINENDWKLRGIVNGIDVKEWNPQLDIYLKSDGYVNYSLETLQTGKPQCKAALQKELGLPIREDVPLIGFIGRLDNQKGVDLIAEAVPWMVGQDVQLVMLGTGRHDLEQMLRQFENNHHDKIRGWVGFSVKTAHRITAGADILLMPSRFEPCGLNQLYAMMYGTIPVVHAVGGLRDTVQPFDPFKESGVGWTFDRAEKDRLIHALGNCLLTYRQYKQSWEGIQKRGMMQDLSWDHAAQNYEEVLLAAKYQW